MDQHWQAMSLEYDFHQTCSIEMQYGDMKQRMELPELSIRYDGAL